MYQREKAFVASRELVISVLAFYFCNPPLNDVSEIETLINIEKRVSKPSSTNSELTRMEVEVFFMDHLRTKWGPYQYAFDKETKNWYRYSSNDGIWHSIDEVEMMRVVCEYMNEQPDFSFFCTKSIIQAIVQTLQIYFLLSVDHFFPEPGLAFTNGWYSFKTHEFMDHEPNRFVHHQVPVDYLEDTPLGDQMKNVLMDLTVA